MPNDPTEQFPEESKLNKDLLKDVEVLTDYEIADVPKEVLVVCEEIKNLGGRAFLVGGVVRDTVINAEHSANISSKDFDIEVFGVDKSDLASILIRRFGTADVVGQQFGVYKIPVPGLSEPLDFALARQENKSGVGHKGFEVDTKPELTLRDAAIRRDLSLNAMAYDPLTKELFDPFHGVESIRNKQINITERSTFVEDPLRVLRVAQFAARFDYSVGEETTALCTEMIERDMLKPVKKADNEEGVTTERISIEFEKLFSKGKRPSIGVDFLGKVGYLDKYITYSTDAGERVAITQLEKVLQEEDWHPEGDAWTHTKECLDAGAVALAIEAKSVRSAEVAGVKFENIPSFILDAQLEELVKSARASAEGKANDFRTELVEGLIASQIPEDFPLLQKEHEERVLKEFREKYKEYIQEFARVQGQRGETLTKRALDKKEAEFMSVARAHFALEWSQTIDGLFESLVKEGKITQSDIESIEKRAQENVDFYFNRKVGLDRRVLERDMKMCVMFGIWFHDVGKIETTELIEGKYRAFGHAAAGMKPASQMLEFFDFNTVSAKTRRVIPELIKYHMEPWEVLDEYEKYIEAEKLRAAGKPVPEGYPKRDPRLKLVKRARFFNEIGGNIMLLGVVAEADKEGRRPKEEGTHPLTRAEIPDNKVERMYELIRYARDEAFKQQESKQGLLTGAEILGQLKLKRGGPFVKVLMRAVDIAEESGVISGGDSGKQEALKMITAIYGRLSEYVSSHSTNESEALTVWETISKAPDINEFLA